MSKSRCDDLGVCAAHSAARDFAVQAAVDAYDAHCERRRLSAKDRAKGFQGAAAYAAKAALGHPHVKCTDGSCHPSWHCQDYGCDCSEIAYDRDNATVKGW